jgi:signal peptidase I
MNKEDVKTQKNEKKKTSKKPEYKFSGPIGLVERIVGGFTRENGIDWLKSIAIAVFIALFIRYFFFEPFKIPSGSMMDTLLIKDKIIVNKFTYGFRIPFTGKRFLKMRDIRRGDIVVFKAPEAASKERKNFVKRVVALPGERVKINDGHICINGERITSPPAVADREYTKVGTFGTVGEVRVPDGEVYVLGDNSRSSRDSRFWGYVPVEDVKGPAVAIWWPPWRIRRLK